MAMAETTRPRYPWGVQVAFVLLLLLYIGAVPPGSGPDEADHLAYLRALVVDHRLPVLRDVPHILMRSDGSGQGDPAPVPTGLAGPYARQAQHPPLGYLPAVPLGWLVWLVGQPAFITRLIGLLWGSLTLWAGWRLGREVYAGRPLVRVALLTIPLLPGPLYMCAVFSNDGAAMAAGAIVWWRLATWIAGRRTRRDELWLGLAVGIALLVKSTALIFGPLVVLAELLAGRLAGDGWRTRLAHAGRILGTALVVSGWWYLRNWLLYGQFLVRSDLRPVLYSLAQFTGHPDTPLFTIVTVLYGLLCLLPTCLAPLWLAYVYGAVIQPFGLAFLTPAAVGWYGLREARRTVAPAERAVLAVAGWGVLLMAVLVQQQLLFQDAEVALFGGRYLLLLIGALLTTVAAGYEANLSALWAARMARVLPWVAGLANLPVLWLVTHPL